MSENIKEAKVVEEVEKEEVEEEPTFENYKQKQRYYDEKYKNRGSIFFAQRGSAEVFANGMSGSIKREKGRTYRKDKNEL